MNKKVRRKRRDIKQNKKEVDDILKDINKEDREFLEKYWTRLDEDFLSKINYRVCNGELVKSDELISGVNNLSENRIENVGYEITTPEELEDITRRHIKNNGLGWIGMNRKKLGFDTSSYISHLWVISGIEDSDIYTVDVNYTAHDRGWEIPIELNKILEAKKPKDDFYYFEPIVRNDE